MLYTFLLLCSKSFSQSWWNCLGCVKTLKTLMVSTRYSNWSRGSVSTCPFYYNALILLLCLLLTLNKFWWPSIKKLIFFCVGYLQFCSIVLQYSKSYLEMSSLWMSLAALNVGSFVVGFTIYISFIFKVIFNNVYILYLFLYR